MKISFYNCKSARNVINKTLEVKGPALEINWKEDNNVISPYVKLRNYPGGNYAKIVLADDTLLGYYFVKSINYLKGSIYGLDLELDPLYTYKSEIESATIKVEKVQVLSNAVETPYTRDNALLLIGG